MSPVATPRPGLREVEPYVSPQLEVPARLNTNECPTPLPPAFTEDLAEQIAATPLNRYPDGEMRELREALATHTGHDLAGTWAANGSNEVLLQLLAAYGGPGRRTVVFEPTYLLHSRIARLTQTEVFALRLNEQFKLTSAAIAEALELGPDVVFVCSPNNPTGNAQEQEIVGALATETSALVIVDEAYIEFGGKSTIGLIGANPNIAVVRTFSKAFSLAGARIGYLLSSEGVIEDLRRIRLPYNLSSLAQVTGLVALRHTDEAAAALSSIREQRDRILVALGEMPGVRAFPSDANFVLFVPPQPASLVWEELLRRGVLVRDMSSVVPGALRVTAGTEKEIDLFLTSLKEVLGA